MNRPRIAVLLVVLAAWSCATSPTGRTQLKLASDRDMARLGTDAYDKLKQETPRSTDARAIAYVTCVADAITREVGGDTVWEVNLFADEQVNAFALPGGKIGVYAGLLGVAENQDQLASVIGHEVGHVLAKHGNARYSAALASQIGLAAASAALGSSGSESNQTLALLGVGLQVGVLMPYGRAHESEADEIGLDLMARAGFDPRASVALWNNMGKSGGSQPPEFLSTHPSHRTRIKDLNRRMARATQTYERARQQGRNPSCG